METTFSKLKVDSRVVFGMHKTVVQEAYRPYYVSPPEEEPITWIKCGGNDNLLISEMVLDVLSIDARETVRRPPEYSRYPYMNIHQYLNAEGEGWFIPAYEGDSAPAYTSSPGFLSGFSLDEIDAMLPMPVPGCLDGENLSCLVRLPKADEVFPSNGTTLPFFKRYARRASATRYIRAVWNNNHYCPYAFADMHDSDRISIIGRDGIRNDYGWAQNKNGIRPMISIRPDARFVQHEDGLYHFVPHAEKMDSASDDDLLALLGI